MSFLHPSDKNLKTEVYYKGKIYVINTEKFWYQVILITNVAEHLMWSTHKIYFNLLH